MFGDAKDIDPIHHLFGTASGWGGNAPKDAMYMKITPTGNDGVKPHTLTVKDVPVDGFWSISLYNGDGFFAKNAENAYSVNITAKKDADGAYRIHFGGDPKQANYLAIMPGWNYTVRLYRPRKALLDGTWTFPVAQPVN